MIMSPSGSQRLRTSSFGTISISDSSGIQNEQILVLIFRSIKWDPHALSATASVNRRLQALAKRRLWQELCAYRAPGMVSSLLNGFSSSRIGGGWHALAKMLFYCCGCSHSTRYFHIDAPVSGHFVRSSRFSKTSGRSFLMKKCRDDLLFVSDPCEHHMRNRGGGGGGGGAAHGGGGGEDDLGVYRGVFRGFTKSKTRATLIRRQVGLEDRVRCPYCGSRVWSMTNARLVPKSAARRLGTDDGGLEFFVCLNGHLHGTCWLVPLSDENGDDDEDDLEENDDQDDYADGDGDDEENEDSYYGSSSVFGNSTGTAGTGSTSSTLSIGGDLDDVQGLQANNNDLGLFRLNSNN